MPPGAAASAAQQLLELSDERDRWLARSLRMWRAGWQAGYAAGLREGREDAHRELADAWRAAADPVAHGGPDFAEFEQRRWTLRGEPRSRETFRQPHPADYLGQYQEGAA